MKFFNVLKNKYIFFILSSLCICLVFFLYARFFESKKELSNWEREKILNKIISKTARQLSKRYHMRQIGDSGGMPGGIIQSLGGSFEKDSGSLEEARQITVDGCLEFLKAINSSEVLRPYLVNYPFTYKNVSLSVFFHNNNYDTEDNNLNVVSCSSGNIYYLYMKKGENGDYSKEIKESFEEAIQKLEKKNAKIENG